MMVDVWDGDRYVVGLQNAADWAGVHINTIWKWIDNGHIRAEKVNGRWHIQIKSLMGYACPNGMTIRQAATYANMPVMTIYELVKTGRLKARRVRNRWIIDPSSWEAYMVKKEEFDKNWLTRHEAQVIAQVGNTTIDNWIRAGHFETARFGLYRMVDRRSFMAYVRTKRWFNNRESWGDDDLLC